MAASNQGEREVLPFFRTPLRPVAGELWSVGDVRGGSYCVIILVGATHNYFGVVFRCLVIQLIYTIWDPGKSLSLTNLKKKKAHQKTKSKIMLNLRRIKKKKKGSTGI